MPDLSWLVPGWANFLVIPGLIAGFTAHELAHAFVAYHLGDVSQVERGRITLNPLRHIFWLGLVTFIFFGFGWARPVRVDSRAFKRRYLDLFLVSIAGAVGNLLLAGLVLALMLLMVMLVAAFSQQGAFEILRSVTVEPAAEPGIVAWAAAFTTYAIYVNLALAFFNLLPLPGLDGFNAIVSLVGLSRAPADGEQAMASGGGQPLSMKPVTVSVEGRRQPADIHFERGAAYHTDGQYEDAIARYRQAIAHDNHYGPAYVNMGLAYLALERRDRAIQAFRGATQNAADEKSRREAWAQINSLSQYQPVGAQETADAAGGQGGPRTESQSSVNWPAFWLNALVVLVASAGVYVYLTISLIHHFS
jgi:Zn-dependent protease